MKFDVYGFGFLSLILSVWACGPKSNEPSLPGKIDLKALSVDSMYMVVETGAGSIPQWSWQANTNQWARDTPTAAWDFLPTVINHGKLIFERKPSRWPTLLLTERVAPGEILNCRPLAVMSLETSAGTFQYLLVLPFNSSQPSIHPTSFIDFMTRYDGVRHILETWLIHQHGLEVVQRVQWLAESQVYELLSSEVNDLKK